MVLEDFEKFCRLTDFDKKRPVIRWKISSLCNYKCSYCAQKNTNVATKQQIEEEWKKIKETAKEVSRVAKELYKKFNKKIKLSLIGGELTLFDNLIEIIPNNGTVERVNIVTNLSRPAEYYIELGSKLKQRNIELYIQASFHREGTNVQTFCNKAAKIKKEYYICCETVISKQDNKQDFIDLCKKLELNYLAEKNILDKELIKNEEPLARSVNKQPSIKITDKKGNENYLYLQDMRKKYPYGAPSYEKYCSTGYSFLFVKNNKVDCLGIDIRDFHILSSPTKCQDMLCKKMFCGVTIVSKNKKDIIVNEED